MLRGLGCLPVARAAPATAAVVASAGSSRAEFRVITSGLSLDQAPGSGNRVDRARVPPRGCGPRHEIPHHVDTLARIAARWSIEAGPATSRRRIFHLVAQNRLFRGVRKPISVSKCENLSTSCRKVLTCPGRSGFRARNLGAMEFAEVVKRRRMVRNYDPDKPVSRDQLERIAAAAQRAPSAGFSQGQRIVIVTDPDRRARGSPKSATSPATSRPVSIRGSVARRRSSSRLSARRSTTDATRSRTKSRTTAQRSTGRSPTGTRTSGPRLCSSTWPRSTRASSPVSWGSPTTQNSRTSWVFPPTNSRSAWSRSVTRHPTAAPVHSSAAGCHATTSPTGSSGRANAQRR